MRILLVSLITLFPFLFSGCAANMPQTAQDFRLAVPGFVFAGKESFEVNRPFNDVVAIFKRQAVKCLDVTIQTTATAPGSYQVLGANWNPTFIATDKQAELHLQRIWEKGVVQVGSEPAKGHFVMVVDIVPVSARKTRIDMYRPNSGANVIIKAIKNWANNKDIGCPDMTKTG
jgi:hypothetical protein